MAKVKVRLLKPLNGAEIGSEAEYNQQDVDRLVKLGAVEIVSAKAKAKAAPRPKNKMEKPPKNKADDSDKAPPEGGDKPVEGEQQG
jgi:hypothetical protein